jgi:hypothetical protein
LYSLASAAVKNMQLSDTLESPDTLISIASALKGIPLANMVMLQYPTLADPTNPNRLVPNTGADDAVNAALLSDQPVTLTGTTGRGASAIPWRVRRNEPARRYRSGVLSKTIARSLRRDQGVVDIEAHTSDVFSSILWLSACCVAVVAMSSTYIGPIVRLPPRLPSADRRSERPSWHSSTRRNLYTNEAPLLLEG